MHNAIFASVMEDKIRERYRWGNMELKFIKVSSKDDIKILAKIANEVWHQHFTSILTLDQIDYMVDKFQSEQAMTEQINSEGYEYYFLQFDGKFIGYTGFREDNDKLFLSKLYILKDHRGNRFASNTFDFLQSICKERGLHAIWLTVNRYNDNTIEIYKKKGFKIIRTQVADIGNGYVMDDYIMEKDLSMLNKGIARI